MNLIKLARISAEAELLRWKLFARRQAMRSVWTAVAAVFALFTLIMVHIAAIAGLWTVMGAYAPLVVLGVDLLLTAIFGMMGLRSTPGLAEREAHAISLAAQRRIKDSASTYVMLAPVAKAAGSTGVKGMMMTALFTRLLSGSRRR